MKKYLLLPVLLLASCGGSTSTPLDISTSLSTSTSLESTSTSLESTSTSVESTSPSSESPSEYVSPINVPNDASEILNFEFGGLSGNEFEGFFNIGWSTGNSKFYDLDLRLIDDEGYFRTPELAISKTKLYVVMKSHITGLNALNANAVGKTMNLAVSGLDSEGEVVVESTYTHTVTTQEITDQKFADFPSYSSDFSKNPYIVELEGEGIVKIRVQLVNKISFTGDGGNKSGCNFAIKNLTILE